MKRIATAIAAALLGLGTVADIYAQGRHNEKPHGIPPTSAAAPSELPQGAIALKDGSKLIFREDDTTYHMDPHGRRVRMRDGGEHGSVGRDSLDAEE